MAYMAILERSFIIQNGSLFSLRGIVYLIGGVA